MSAHIGPMVRIARGELAEDALAALISVLIVLTKTAEDTPAPSTSWRNLNWRNPYRSPASWHNLPRINWEAM